MIVVIWLYFQNLYLVDLTVVSDLNYVSLSKRGEVSERIFQTSRYMYIYVNVNNTKRLQHIAAHYLHCFGVTNVQEIHRLRLDANKCS